MTLMFLAWESGRRGRTGRPRKSSTTDPGYGDDDFSWGATDGCLSPASHPESSDRAAGLRIHSTANDDLATFQFLEDIRLGRRRSGPSGLNALEPRLDVAILPAVVRSKLMGQQRLEQSDWRAINHCIYSQFKHDNVSSTGWYNKMAYSIVDQFPYLFQNMELTQAIDIVKTKLMNKFRNSRRKQRNELRQQAYGQLSSSADSVGDRQQNAGTAGGGYIAAVEEADDTPADPADAAAEPEPCSSRGPHDSCGRGGGADS